METHTNTAAIEISDTSVKFAVGYCLNKKPVIVYLDSRPLKEGWVVDGRIINQAEVSKIVAEFLNIADDSIRAKVNGICSVVIPSIGYKLLSANPNTYCSSQNGVIGPMDVQYLINQVQNQGIQDEYKIIDIIPLTFVTSDGNKTDYPPYNVKSNTLAAEVAVHAVGINIYNEQRVAIENSGFRVDYSAVAAYSSGYLITNQYRKNIGHYFYVDLGAKTTSVSLIDSKCMPWYASSFTKRGGDDLTSLIASRLKIDRGEAEKLKIRYGYNPVVRTYELPLFEGINLEGEQITVYQRDLNALIEEFFASLFKNILNCMEIALQTSSSIPQQFPVIVGGGASKLIGIEHLLEKFKPNCKDIKLFVPNVAGARDPGLIPLLGLIALNGKEQRQVDPAYRGMSTLTRQ